MKLPADESVDRQIVDRLRGDGHQVDSIAELRPGADDAEVLGVANRQDSVLITADKDFGELVFRLHQISRGVLLLRLHALMASQAAQITGDAVRDHGAEMVDAFSVLTPGMLRIRRSI